MKAIFRICVPLLLCAALCVNGLCARGETFYTAEYCFRAEDFSPETEGIFVTAVPDAGVAVVRLGDRCIVPGDVLPANRLDELTLVPCCEENCEVTLSYQPIVNRALGAPAQVTIRIHSGKNETPRAKDAKLETYRNIANNGTLLAEDAEGGKLMFAVAESPKRGTVELEENGHFVYTPEKNKVGEDSFTFTVTDEAGNVSKPATVRIRILKPTETGAFADMKNHPAHYEALWAEAKGLLGGRELAGHHCFCPDESVSRIEFLTMAMALREYPVDESLTVSAFADAAEAPEWAQPYLAAAVRGGIVRGEVDETGLRFRPNDAITGQEAAVILQNLWQLPISAAQVDRNAPAWCAAALQALSEAGLRVEPTNSLSRSAAACLLYDIQ